MPIYISGSGGTTTFNAPGTGSSSPIEISGSDGSGTTTIDSGSFIVSGSGGTTAVYAPGTGSQSPIEISGSDGSGTTTIDSGSFMVSGSGGTTAVYAPGTGSQSPIEISGSDGSGTTTIDSGSFMVSGSEGTTAVYAPGTGSQSGIIVSGSEKETKYGMSGSTSTDKGSAKNTYFGSGIQIRGNPKTGVGLIVSGTVEQSGSGNTFKIQDNLWIYRLSPGAESNYTTLAITGTAPGGGVDPIIKLVRSSSSPAAFDRIGNVDWYAYNDAGEETRYGGFMGMSAAVTNGSEDFKLSIQTVKAGTISDSLTFTATETVVNDASGDVDFRVEADLSASMLIVSGGAHYVGVGFNTSPALNATLHISGSTALEAQRTGNRGNTGGNTHTFADNATVYIFTSSAPTLNIMTASLPTPAAARHRLYHVKSLHQSNAFVLAITASAIAQPTFMEGAYGGIKLTGVRPAATLYSDGFTYVVLSHTGTMTSTA